MGIECRTRYRRDKRGRKKQVGNSYTVRYRGKGLGTYHRKSDAENVLTQAKAEFKTTGRIKAFKEITVSELIAKHLGALRGKRLKKSTLAGYGNYLSHFKQSMGEDRRVSTISHEDLELFVTELSEERDLAPLTVNCIVQAVAQMFDAAVRWNYLSENLARQVTNRPRRRRLCEVKVLTVEEHKRLVAATNPHYRLMVQAWPFIAARPSEMYGLRVGDFDSEARVLRIERQYKGGEYSGLKHDGSPRTLHLDERTSLLLDEQIAKLGDRASPDAPLFQSEQGRPVNSSWFHRGVFKKAVEQAKLTEGVTPHTLRHCGATWLLEAGTSLMYTAKHLGHSNPSITASTYSHLLAEVDKSAMSRLNRWYEGMAEAYESIQPKAVGNGVGVEYGPECGWVDQYSPEELEELHAVAERQMEAMKDEFVDELVRMAKLRRFNEVRNRVATLREHLDVDDVDAVLARASEQGVAVGIDTKMTQEAEEEGETAT